MKRYLWQVQVRGWGITKWQSYSIEHSRAHARWAAKQARYPYRRIVKYVSER